MSTFTNKIIPIYFIVFYNRYLLEPGSFPLDNHRWSSPIARKAVAGIVKFKWKLI